jgi:hypothetical protein
MEDGDPMDDADIRRPGKVGRRRSEALAQRRQLWSVFALGESLTVRTFAFGGPLGAVLPSQMSDDHDRAPPSEQLGEIGRRRRVYDFSGFGRAAK